MEKHMEKKILETTEVSAIVQRELMNNHFTKLD